MSAVDFLSILIPLVVIAFLLVRFKQKWKEGAKANQAWRDFALQKGLREEEPQPDSITDINRDVLKDLVRAKRVTDLKPSKLFRGENQGFPFELAMVIKHGDDTSKMELFTRMAVELPGVAKDLRVYPEKISSKIGKVFGAQDISSGDEGFDQQFMIKGSDADEVRRYLTPDRRHALLAYSKDLGQLEINNGHLYLVRKGQIGQVSELSLLYSKMGTLASSLADI